MYALIDCNNFFVSCERLFNPKLANKPVVVLSNNDGCVIARSNEAKSIGIKMGEPVFKIKEFIEKNDVAVFSSNYNLYGDISNRVMNTIITVVDNIEVYSIDEAFVDLTNYKYHDLAEIGVLIKERVFQWVGIPVSIGIAPTKTLAKVASKLSKKQNDYNGVCVLLSKEDIDKVLIDFPVEDLWGVGRKISKHLKNIGINTAKQLLEMNEAFIQRNFTITGLRLVQELKAISCIKIENIIPPKKNICTSRSFGKMVSDFSALAEAVSNFAARCAEKLRRQKSCCNMILVFLNTNPFRDDLKQYYRYIFIPLPVATSSTSEIIHYALIGLQSIYKSGYAFKKAGIIVSEIIPSNQVQQNLFDAIDRERVNKLMETLDKLNNKMGRDKVKMVSQGTGKREWKLRQEQLSPSYTTNWNEILEVKA